MNPDSSSYFQQENDKRLMTKRKVTFIYYLVRFWLAGRYDKPYAGVDFIPPVRDLRIRLLHFYICGFLVIRMHIFSSVHLCYNEVV